jgi:hypothetical protein
MPIRVPVSGEQSAVGQYLPWYLAYYPEPGIVPNEPTGPVDPTDPDPPHQQVRDPRRLWLEAGTAVWRPGVNALILKGATGLNMPPRELVTAASPGVVGTTLQEVKVGQREVFLPVHLSSDKDPVDFLDALADFESVAVPAGTLQLVASSHKGERQLGVVYSDGLAGDEGQDASGSMWCRIGLKFIAPDPWWRDREESAAEFAVAPPAAPLVGKVGATDALWPGMLASSTVIGQGMEIRVASAIEVYPTLELTGPMTSFAGSMDTGWSVSVPGGVPAGKTLRIVTDPRARSIRLDGELAAGRVARGSQLQPFSPGVNLLNVLAPGADERTKLRLSWRGGWRTAWGS